MKKEIKHIYKLTGNLQSVTIIASGLLILLFTLTSNNSCAQKERKSIREGNKLYEEKKYTEAEKKYNQALEKNKNSFEGTFNLGDALYKLEKYKEAGEKFE